MFLWHVPSALIPIVTIPVAVLLAFIPFRMMGITANIMSLGGIAIAIGELVDAAIVVVEQTHKKLEQWQQSGRARRLPRGGPRGGQGGGGAELLRAAGDRGLVPAGADAEAQEGRLFKPLAYTKTLAMLVAAVLAITLDPALRLLFTRVERFEFRPALAVPGRERGARRRSPAPRRSTRSAAS